MRKQKQINELFKEYGLTDEILEKQVEINTKRNKLDICDETEIIYDKYVQ